MKHSKKNMANKPEEELSRDILSRMEIPFARSKDESWTELQKKMGSEHMQETGLHRSISKSHPLLLAAASIALLLTVTAFLRYYTKTVTTGTDIFVLTLPDKSKAELAENSTASWHPFWWRFNREINLDGEALFTVQRGKTFTVASEGGTTEVLGTTFRVTARPEIYQVACYEGSVKVTGAGSEVAATLTANEQVIVYKDGRYSITLIGDDREAAESSGTKASYEAFRSVPAQEVFGKIARQYGIIINAEAAAGLLFTGNLQFNGDPEKLLNAVCRPLELRYEKTGDNEFVILHDKQ
jgi:transmembrane sensor